MWKIALFLFSILLFSLVGFQLLHTQKNNVFEGMDTTNENFCSHVSDAIDSLNKLKPGETPHSDVIMDIKAAMEIKSNDRNILSYLTQAKMGLQNRARDFTDVIVQLNRALDAAGCTKTIQTSSSSSSSSSSNNNTHTHTTIYSNEPDWLHDNKTLVNKNSLSTNLNVADNSIQSALDELSTYPPNIQGAIINIQSAQEYSMGKYKENPSQQYIEVIHELTAALNDLRGTPINISDTIAQLKAARTTLNNMTSEKQQQQPQQNCFNQTYVTSVCPQSVIENFSVQMSTFKKANNSFIQCLDTTKNGQYDTLMGKLKQVQSLLEHL
jgi:hypothetical protein